MLEQIVATQEQPVSNESVDWRVIARCQQGDREALRALFERYKDRVYSIAMYSLGGDEQLASDVTQQVFIKLMTRIGQFRGDSEFATWLYRLVVNTCRDLAERQVLRRGEELPAEDLRVDDESDPSRLAMIADLRGELGQALSRLTADQRRVVLLRDGLGLSYDEIARLVRIPAGTAKSYVHRAHKRLRGRLQEHAPA